MCGERAKWIVGLIVAPDLSRPQLFEDVAEMIGKVERSFGPFPFNSTGYYGKEMGENLVRYWLSADGLHDAAGLVALKHRAARVEDRFRRDASDGGGRRANVDPGYLTAAKLVLSTHKNFSHRIYLGEGVFAEVTLSFSRNRIIHHQWTYPDFRAGLYDQSLKRIRDDYLSQLHGSRNGVRDKRGELPG